MTVAYLKELLNDCCNDISFNYAGKSCGVIPEVNNYKPVYHVWCGTNTKDFYDAKSVLTTNFFAGKTLENICEQMDFDIS